MTDLNIGTLLQMLFIALHSLGVLPHSFLCDFGHFVVACEDQSAVAVPLGFGLCCERDVYVLKSSILRLPPLDFFLEVELAPQRHLEGKAFG